MADREKVIKGLETCISCINTGCQKICPYYESCFQYDATFVFRPMLRDALALLREQEPVKPIKTPETIRVEYNCGGCGYLVGFVSTIHDDMHYRAKFCPECGRKVAWP